ncbi:MAG: hypothetical protein ABI906_03065 [Pseudomonadota bacterium]
MGRRDRRGAGFFLADAEVVANTATDITVITGGAVQRIPRRRGFSTPAWEGSHCGERSRRAER